MNLLNIKRKELLPARIDKVNAFEFEMLKKSKRFLFDWFLERENVVYKICMENESEILGLISVKDMPRELRLHIDLIEVSRENSGKGKKLDFIAGCLIAYVCKLAFEKDYFGFVSLVPKTNLIGLYQRKYLFKHYGRLMGVDGDDSKFLIKKYLPNEKI